MDTVSAANLGGIADPRLGDEADAIGTTDEHRGGVSHDIAPPDTHGHNTIYLDSSISFENYVYWADRSREFEKHIRTDNVGFSQLGRVLIGRKIADEPPVIDSSDDAAGKDAAVHTDEKNGAFDEKNGDNSRAVSTNKWTHAVTEAEWEQAQRATRTATWGKCGM